jgi:hypothetical protein
MMYNVYVNSNKIVFKLGNVTYRIQCCLVVTCGRTAPRMTPHMIAPRMMSERIYPCLFPHLICHGYVGSHSSCTIP